MAVPMTCCESLWKTLGRILGMERGSISAPSNLHTSVVFHNVIHQCDSKVEEDH